MRTLPIGLVAHTQRLRDPDPNVWLVEVEVPTDPPTRFRLARNPEPVTFGVDSTGAGLVYSPYPIRIGEFQETVEGDIPTLSLEIGNPTRELSAAVDLYDGLVGAPVVIRLVNLGDLSAGALFEERAEIRRVRVTAQACTFVLAAYSLYRVKFPAWRHLAYSCRWQFGGVECGYLIPSSPGETVGTGFSTCGKTFAACGVRGADELARSVTVNHPKRFGAFPGLPRTLGGA